MNFLDEKFYDNTTRQWLIAAAVFVLCLLGLRLLKSLILRYLRPAVEKSKTDIDDLLIMLVEEVRLLVLFVLALDVAAYTLKLPEKISQAIQFVMVLAFLIQGVIWGNKIIQFWVNRFTKRSIDKDPASVTTISALGFVAKFLLWVVLFLLALENLGVNVTGLVAGLGIGGIAIALAVQNILGDLFASLSIVLDKPFVIGDFVIVEDYMGTVKKIGLKTTRIQSLSGEQLVFSNSDLLSSRIRNYKRMYERRVVFSIGVTYQTPYEKLAAIPDMLKDIVKEHEQARLDRAHFSSYGDFSLNYEIVYYVLSPEYNTYMDIQQAINLAIYQRFEQEGIEFAYPTQTLFMQSLGEQDASVSGDTEQSQE